MNFLNPSHLPSTLFSQVVPFWEAGKNKVSRLIHEVEEKTGTNVSRCLPDPREMARLIGFGHPSLEFTHLFRLNGAQIRKVAAHIGFFFGKLSGEVTLRESGKIGWPMAANVELIFGFKPWSFGASIGGNWHAKEWTMNWFKRHQFSMTQAGKDIWKMVVSSSGNSFHRISEIKFYDFQLILNKVGKAFSYHFSQEHYRQAYLLLREEGVGSAIDYLKKYYPHIQENSLRSLLTTPFQSGKIFLGEMASLLGVGTILKNILPEGKISQSIQQGASFAVSNLFRIGMQSATALKSALAVVEAIPLTAIHWGISTAHQKVEKAFHWSHSTLRSIFIEDFGSLALYAGLRSFVTPDRIRQIGQMGAATLPILFRFTPFLLSLTPWMGVGIVFTAFAFGACSFYIPKVERSVSFETKTFPDHSIKMLPPSFLNRSAPSFQKEKVRTTFTKTVYFDSDHSEPTSFTVLKEVKELLKKDSRKYRIQISGYADSTGERSYNQTLSLRRANRIKNYFIQQGILPENLQVKGFGESSPVAQNSTRFGRAQNRRVTLQILDS